MPLRQYGERALSREPKNQCKARFMAGRHPAALMWPREAGATRLTSHADLSRRSATHEGGGRDEDGPSGRVIAAAGKSLWGAC